MNSLQVTTFHSESAGNGNDDDDDDEANVVLTAVQSGNNGDCCRIETPLPIPLTTDEDYEKRRDEEVENDDDEELDHSVMMIATHNQLAQHGFGLHLDVDGMTSSSNTTTTRRPQRTNRRPGKVEFVRFDSKETVYLSEPNEEHDGSSNQLQNEMVRNKIKEEIKR